jgi:hypothetical protein
MRDEVSTYEHLKGHLDSLVNRNVSLETLGISVDEFMSQAREDILQRVNDIAAERLEINKE